MTAEEIVLWETADLNSPRLGQEPEELVTCTLVESAMLGDLSAVLYEMSTGGRRIAVYHANGTHVFSAVVAE